MRRNPLLRVRLAMACTLCVPGVTWADGLLDIYRLAAEQDAVLKAAAAAYQAALEIAPQNFSTLLPQAALSANVATNRRDVSNSDNSALDSNSNFSSQGYSLGLTQVLYNRENFVAQRQADSQILTAEATFEAARQELLLRVSERYFAVLAARDGLTFARGEREAIARQLEQAQQRYKAGVAAITDVQEAQARYDLSVAQEIIATNDIAAAEEALREVTGQYHRDLALLKADIPLLNPEPADIEQWVAGALQQNPALRAAEAGVETARTEIERRRAGHYPTLDAVASHAFSDSGGGDFGSRESTDSALGVELNVPIFQGGLIASRTRQAASLLDQAIQTAEQTRRSTQRLSRNAYRGVQSSISTVKAYKQAVLSNQTALKAAEAGNKAGTRTLVDVLDAQSKLYQAERDYARSRYDHLLNTLRLKQAAGTIAEQDIVGIDSWLVSGAENP